MEVISDALVITKKHISKDEWCQYIHNYVKDNKVGYMEAITDYCDIEGIEVESVATLVDDNIKGILRDEAVQLNMMKDIGKIDFETE